MRSSVLLQSVLRPIYLIMSLFSFFCAKFFLLGVRQGEVVCRILICKFLCVVVAPFILAARVNKA
jgi:hypothetical protein